MLLELFITLLISTFAISIIVYFRVKYLLRKLYPEKHDAIFAKNIMEHSVGSSMSFARFTFKESEWRPISNPLVLRWLRINKIVAAIYYGIGIFAILRILYAVAYELLFT